jgi:hypothetical protein
MDYQFTVLLIFVNLFESDMHDYLLHTWFQQ